MSLIRPDEIEREIARSIAASAAARTRASLFNLIVFRRAFRENPAEAALGYMLGKRPARIIIVESGFEGATEVEASARCHPDPRNAELCFQEIHIRCGPDGMGEDPGFWSPLLIREIPSLLWWLHPLDPVPPLFRRAGEHVDRILVDSGYGQSLGEQPLAACRSLAGYLQRPGAVPVSDFAWHRLLPLRVGAARLFNPPQARALLPRITSVELQGGEAAEGILFFSWLAERLGRRLDPQKDTGRASAAGGPAAEGRDLQDEPIRAVHRDPGPLREGFRAVFTTAAGERLRLECREDGCGCLSADESEEEPLRFHVPEAGEVLLRETDSIQEDPLLASALRVAAESFPSAVEGRW